MFFLVYNDDQLRFIPISLASLRYCTRGSTALRLIELHRIAQTSHSECQHSYYARQFSMCSIWGTLVVSHVLLSTPLWWMLYCAPVTTVLPFTGPLLTTCLLPCNCYYASTFGLLASSLITLALYCGSSLPQLSAQSYITLPRNTRTKFHNSLIRTAIMFHRVSSSELW